jgi:endonuclease V
MLEGCAKTLLHVDGLSSVAVKELVRASIGEEGGHVELRGDSGKVRHTEPDHAQKAGRDTAAWLADAQVWGAALRLNAEVQNPIFISIGHRLGLASAVDVVKACSRHRVPEPIRQADIRSRAVIRGLKDGRQEDGGKDV